MEEVPQIFQVATTINGDTITKTHLHPLQKRSADAVLFRAQVIMPSLWGALFGGLVGFGIGYAVVNEFGLNRHWLATLTVLAMGVCGSLFLTGGMSDYHERQFEETIEPVLLPVQRETPAFPHNSKAGTQDIAQHLPPFYFGEKGQYIPYEQVEKMMLMASKNSGRIKRDAITIDNVIYADWRNYMKGAGGIVDTDSYTQFTDRGIAMMKGEIDA